jgi:hypothetical protein
MEGWFQRACAREPVNRHQSAQEFIDTLRAAAGEPPRDAHVAQVPPQPATLVSASAAERPDVPANAGSIAPPMGQTSPNVSVTAATESGTLAGLPRVRPAVVLAGMGVALMAALTVVVWLVFSPHGPPPSLQTDEMKDQGTGVRPATSPSVAPPVAARSEPADAASAPSTHASEKPRAQATPPAWVPPPAPPRAPTPPARAVPQNPLGY